LKYKKENDELKLINVKLQEEKERDNLKKIEDDEKWTQKYETVIFFLQISNFF
jgi:hypothetical protein